MSIPRSVHACVEASRLAPDLAINEDAGKLFVAGTLPRAALLAWQEVYDTEATWLSLRCVDASNDDVAPASVPDGERVRLTVVHEPVEGAAHAFTPEGWRYFLMDDARIGGATVVRLAFLGDGESFATRAFIVECWGGEPRAADRPKTRPDPGPRRVVRSQSPTFMAPSRIEPFVAVSAPPSGPAASVWREVSAAMIARSLPNDLYRDGDMPKVMLAGQPPRKLALGDEGGGEGFQSHQDAASWTYLEGTDVEVRHTFLSAELAREWTPGATFSAGLATRLSPALDSARLLYKAHLRSGSKDTLKALSDLRKTLADEVQKLMQQSRDLSSAVFRDVAVAVGAMAIRLAVDSVKASAMGTGFAWVFLAVAVYVAASFGMTVSTNRRFLAIVEESRTAWRTKLYGFLDDDDYGSLAERPVTEALDAYARTEWRAKWFVGVVVFLLLAGAAVEFGWVDLPSTVARVTSTVGELLDLLRQTRT